MAYESGLKCDILQNLVACNDRQRSGFSAGSSLRAEVKLQLHLRLASPRMSV